MIKHILFIIIISMPVFCYSQAQDKKYYKAKAIYNVHWDKKWKETIKNPYGRNVSLEYDGFFKKWKITCTDYEEKKEVMIFSFWRKVKNDNIYHNDFLWTSWKGFDFIEINEIETNGLLYFIHDWGDNYEGFVIEGITSKVQK